MKGIFSPKVVGFSGMAWVFQRHHCWKRLGLQKTGQSLPPKVYFYRIVFNSHGTHIKGSLGQLELLKREGLCQDFRWFEPSIFGGTNISFFFQLWPILNLPGDFCHFPIFRIQNKKISLIKENSYFSKVLHWDSLPQLFSKTTSLHFHLNMMWLAGLSLRWGRWCLFYPPVIKTRGR